jgi:hypothetical protein
MTEKLREQNICSFEAAEYEYTRNGYTRSIRSQSYCNMTATWKHYPVGAVPGHFNYLCDEHAAPIISGKKEKC